MGKGARSSPSSEDIWRTQAWLEIADQAKAWNWLIGRRIQALREEKKKKGLSKAVGPRRGVHSSWGSNPENFSQDAFARRLGFSQSWLAKIEQGHRPVTVFEAHYIAKGLDVDPEEILRPPSEQERRAMSRIIADIERARDKEHITAGHLAAESVDAKNRRRRSSPRTRREQERLEASRKALPPKTGRSKKKR